MPADLSACPDVEFSECETAGAPRVRCDVDPIGRGRTGLGEKTAWLQHTNAKAGKKRYGIALSFLHDVSSYTIFQELQRLLCESEFHSHRNLHDWRPIRCFTPTQIAAKCSDLQSSCKTDKARSKHLQVDEASIFVSDHLKT